MNEKISPADKPLVSVIMAVYNGEKYLEEAVGSVLAQTYGNLELIVTDDGSTDRTAKILARISGNDSRVRTLRIDNSGLSAARNAALDVARGDIITFIDSDDTYHPAALSRFVRLMCDEDADVVAGNMIMRESEPPGWRETPLDAPTWKTMDGREALTVSLYQRPALNSVCQLAVRGEMFRGEEGLRFVKGLYYEDLELTSRLYMGSRRVVVSGMEHYFYRQEGGSFIHRFSEKRLDVLKVTSGIERMVADGARELRKAAYDRRFSACYNIYLLLGMEGESRYADVTDMCWDEICRRRVRTLLNPRVRIKNRIGALCSFFGRKMVRMLNRLGPRR